MLKSIELYSLMDVFIVYEFYLNKDAFKKYILYDSIYIKSWKMHPNLW